MDEREVAAVGRPQRAEAGAAAVLALAAVAAVMLWGGAQRWSSLFLLLPTLAATALLIALPVVIPRKRARTTVVRFRVTAVSGDVTECELVGLPAAPLPRPGDGVEVFGRPGALVRAEEIVRGDERLRGRPGPAFVLARHAALVALALSVVAGVIALVVSI